MRRSPSALAPNLKAARIAKGLSQKRLAVVLGVSPTFVCRVEAGKSLLSVVMLCAVADALETTTDELLLAAETDS